MRGAASDVGAASDIVVRALGAVAVEGAPRPRNGGVAPRADGHPLSVRLTRGERARPFTI